MASAEELLDLLLRLSTAMATDLSEFSRRTGLTPARLHLLWLLADGPLPQHALARALGVAPRTITQHVDGAVAAGHACRRPSPTDRRSVLVELTTDGQSVVEGLRRGRYELAHQVFGSTATPRLQVVEEVLLDLVDGVERALEQS